jgi:RNA recognition motif-containing protein
MNIYVGNLPYDVSEMDLQDAFEAFGTVASVNLIKDKLTGQSKGFAFVEMASTSEAQAAITGLHGKEFNGRTLNVNEARPRADNRRPGGQGNRGQGGGGQGGRRRF